LIPQEAEIHFDDGWLCQYEIGMHLLENANRKAWWFIPTADLETPERISKAQLKDLAQRHEVGCHGHVHTDLRKLTQTQIEEQLGMSLNILEDLIGRPVSRFTAPYEFYNERVITAAAKYNLTTHLSGDRITMLIDTKFQQEGL